MNQKVLLFLIYDYQDHEWQQYYQVQQNQEVQMNFPSLVKVEHSKIENSDESHEQVA